MNVKNQNTGQDVYNRFLLKYLKEHLFATGSDLKELLSENFRMTGANARQAVSRASRSKVIKSSKPYTFGKGQFLYLFSSVALNEDIVLDICKKGRPPVYRLLRQLKNNIGILSYYEAMKITASPGSATSTKVNTLDDILKLLKKLGLVTQAKDKRGIDYILLNSSYLDPASFRAGEAMEREFSRMSLDASLIPDILRWLNKCNVLSGKNIIFRNKKSPGIGAVHNKLWWDAFGYTKTTGINPTLGAYSETIDKQTLVVLDVVLSGEYNQLQLDGFVSRLQINLNSVGEGKARKVFPIVFYRICDKEVLARLAALGIIAFDIGAVFGAKIYEVLEKLQEVNQLISTGNDIDSTVKSILKTIRRSGNDSVLKDLKGTLFEFLMYPLIKRLYPDASMERGKTLEVKGEKDENGKYTTEKYEYDYIINSSHPREIVFIELKGYMSNATIPVGDIDTRNSLKWFFERTLPFGAKHFKKEVGEGKSIKGIFMTSAMLDEEGYEFVAEYNGGKFRSESVDTGYSRNGLLELLEKNGFTKEAKVIEKFYTADRDKKPKMQQKKKKTKDTFLVASIEDHGQAYLFTNVVIP